MANASPAALDALRFDWGAIEKAAATPVSPQRVQSSSTYWRLWGTFCQSLAVNPQHLPADPIPLLQVFAQRLRTGTLVPGRRSVRSRTVEDIVRAVGQTYASVGAPDPHMNSHDTLDFRLTTLYQAWARLDEPPSRVKPLPLSLLTQAVTIVKQDAHP